MLKRESKSYTKEKDSYLAGWYHNADLLNSLCKFFRFYCSIVVKIKIFEALHQNSFFALAATCFLRQFFEHFLFKTKHLACKFTSLLMNP